jgi:hypothetical protein
MPHLNRSLIYWCFPLLIVSGNCHAQPECDSLDTRNAVLRFILSDRDNQLKNYAAGQSTVPPSSSNPEITRPLYQLGQRIVTTSSSRDKLTLQCSGAISAAVGDTKATKEVTFTVQQSSDGKLSVSVDPFQFDAGSHEGK